MEHFFPSHDLFYILMVHNILDNINNIVTHELELHMKILTGEFVKMFVTIIQLCLYYKVSKLSCKQHANFKNLGTNHFIGIYLLKMLMV